MGINNKVVFCDKLYDRIQKIDDIKVISPEEAVIEYKDSMFVISNIAINSITNFLLDNNVKNDDICIGVNVDEYNQYFDEIVELNNNEIFCDVGCYNGNTSVRFAEYVDYKYKKIYAFEPSEFNLGLIAKNNRFNELDKIELYRVGAWHRSENLKFSDDLSQANKIDESNGEIIIMVDALDNIFRNYNEEDWPTYVKMDIEGAELNALIGAKNIISIKKPKLAISIYHKPEDIIDIIMYIKSLVPEYKLYLRHYGTVESETVLYAII